MANPLQQTIEALAKEKGIEPDVVISAIEEAVATASRKYYKTGENLKTRFNTRDRPGRSLRASRQSSQEVTNAGHRDLARAKRSSSTATKPKSDMEIEFPQADRGARAASPRRPPSR